MAKNERIQVPITAEKKQKLEARSEQLGFDGATDMVRFLINNLLNDSIQVSIEVCHPLIETPKDALET